MSDKDRLLHVLQGVYNYTSLRDGQLEASSAVLHGQDVIVRMTTSSGKTLCYQLPVLAMQGKCCLVISPLNSLMNDQVKPVMTESTLPKPDQMSMTRLRNCNCWVCQQ